MTALSAGMRVATTGDGVITLGPKVRGHTAHQGPGTVRRTTITLLLLYLRPPKYRLEMSIGA